MKTYPVLSRAAVAAAVTALVTVLKVFGVEVAPDLSAKLVDAVLALAPLAAIGWAAYTSHKRVSPVAGSDEPVVIPVDSEPTE